MTTEVHRTTYRDMIRSYADSVRGGTFDKELAPRQARLCAVVLATASNDNRAVITYPPTTTTRDDIIKTTLDLIWDGNARAFLQACSPSAGSDLSIAIERAVTILQDM